MLKMLSFFSHSTFNKKKRKTQKTKTRERERERYRELGVPGEPDGGEVAPTELRLNNVAAILKSIADSNSVVATSSVILRSFVLRRVLAAVAPILR